MSNVTGFWFLLLLLLAREGYSIDLYKLFYLEDFCHSSESSMFVIGNQRGNSTVILQASKDKPFLPNRNCTLWITSPLGYGVVLSVRHLEMRPFKENGCVNYVEITDKERKSQSMLCVYSDDPIEYTSYYTSGDMGISLHTGSLVDGSRTHFTFTITSFLKDQAQCPSDMFHCQNKRCIWRGLTCNGHNNCGDRSDEDRFPCERGKVIAVSVLGVVGAVLVVAGLAYFVLRRRRRRDAAADDDDEELLDEREALLS